MGRDYAEHLSVIEQVFERLLKNNLRLNTSKCSFMQDKLEYCGHTLTRHGIQQSPDKIAAIVNAPAPTKVSQLNLCWVSLLTTTITYQL
jgi:hypothetical protein